MNPASNLILVGPMGAGKSCIGRLLSTRWGLRLADADSEIERRTGVTVTAIFEREGEVGFRTRERAILAELLQGEGMVLATGGGAVVDAENRQLLQSRGFVVHLQLTPLQQLARLARDQTRPLLARQDREEVLHSLAAVRDPLYAEIADLGFVTGEMTSTESVEKLATALDLHWQRVAAA